MDLWRQVAKLLTKHNVVCKWVKGHNNTPLNELADLYATHAAACLNLPEDNGYIND
jgi:ribonuclease HI